MKKNMLGIYIHIPFCRSKCSYCDFASFVLDDEIKRKYIDALVSEIGREARRFEGSADNGRGTCAAAGNVKGLTGAALTVNSVYFGGGTPSLLSGAELRIIFDALRNSFDFSADCEISLEANPDTVTDESAAEWRDAGINRISVGLQTHDDAILKSIGRRHSFDDFLKSAERLKNAGIENLSADVMLGLPGQDYTSALETVKRVSDPEIFKHLSVYGLKVSPGTPLYPYEPDGDLTADMYDGIRGILTERGYARYEISNFSVQDFECRHNLKYWNCDEYLGFGLAAHGFRDMTRTVNPSSIQDYLSGKNRIETRITTNELRSDYIMLRLRTENGVDIETFKARFGADFMSLYGVSAEELQKSGLVLNDGKSLRIATDRFYVSNRIISEFV